MDNIGNKCYKRAKSQPLCGLIILSTTGEKNKKIDQPAVSYPLTTAACGLKPRFRQVIGNNLSLICCSNVDEAQFMPENVFLIDKKADGITIGQRR
ncbi:hypothetical protein [Dickeya chrysanthemi]|uniref:hypothetical protein n=1 Tax=Dickeya chrysanthemi TaxID=556 RepID=UPI0012685045|nr:hypothetical protein [Dickeya chrysanthemi]